MTIKFSYPDKLDFDYLLVGNTRLHWAIRKDNTYDFLHTFYSQTFPKNINFKKLIWASVGKYPENKLSKKMKLQLKNQFSKIFLKT